MSRKGLALHLREHDKEIGAYGGSFEEYMDENIWEMDGLELQHEADHEEKNMKHNHGEE